MEMHKQGNLTPPARLISFYLPQFHPIPENDEWWGKGFTEWTNVVRARPRFDGHYQPRLPSDLGFYDLRLPEVRRAQAELARASGIHGFCYYHYWFEGRMLLERPLNEVLRTGEPDFPFCICWANEDWRRNWDGYSGQVLVAQTYSEQDDLNHIRWLAGAFHDRRYIRVSGKPLVLIYRPMNLPSPARTAKRWREEAMRLGVGDIYLCGVEFGGQPFEPAGVGFDASVEFEPHGIFAESPRHVGTDFVYEYEQVADYVLKRPVPAYKRFPCIFPSWDNSARRLYNRAVIISGSDPEVYGRWLRTLIGRAATQPPEERLIFLNAWNEWGEGAYLEPDLRFGHTFLRETQRALGIQSGDAVDDMLIGQGVASDFAAAAPAVELTHEEAVRSLKAALEDSQEQLKSLRGELDFYRIQEQSRPWRIGKAVHNFLEAIAPLGTRRRRAVQKMARTRLP